MSTQPNPMDESQDGSIHVLDDSQESNALNEPVVVVSVEGHEGGDGPGAEGDGHQGHHAGPRFGPFQGFEVVVAPPHPEIIRMRAALMMFFMGDQTSTHDELTDHLRASEGTRVPYVGSDGAPMHDDQGYDERMWDVFRRVPRAWFVPQAVKAEAVLDRPLPFDVGSASTNLSAAHIYPHFLKLLQLHESNLTFLDIGCGSGYLSVMASLLLGPRGHVYGWDVSQDLIDYAYGCISGAQASPDVDPNAMAPITLYEHNLFHPRIGVGRATFDRIAVGATCDYDMRHHLTQYLAPGGRLVCPIGDGLYLITRSAEGRLREELQSMVMYRSLIVPRRLPKWSPRHHLSYPKEVQRQVETVLAAWQFRPECLWSFLPLECVHHVLCILCQGYVDHMTGRVGVSRTTYAMSDDEDDDDDDDDEAEEEEDDESSLEEEPL